MDILSIPVTAGAEPVGAEPAEAEPVGAGEAQRSKRTAPYFFNGLTVSGRSDNRIHVLI